MSCGPGCTTWLSGPSWLISSFCWSPSSWSGFCRGSDMADETPPTIPLKPGWATTEFWVTSLTQLLAVGGTFGLLTQSEINLFGSWISRGTAAAVVLIAIVWNAAHYTRQRTALKKRADDSKWLVPALLLLWSCGSSILAAPVPAQRAPESIATPRPEPLPEDLLQFPCEWVAAEALRQADAHIAWLEGQTLAWTHDHDLTIWLWEARRLRGIWNELHWAYWVSNNEARRPYLDNLRNLLGNEDYERGLMPPAVPVWRFRQVK